MWYAVDALTALMQSLRGAFISHKAFDDGTA